MVQQTARTRIVKRVLRKGGDGCTVRPYVLAGLNNIPISPRIQRDSEGGRDGAANASYAAASCARAAMDAQSDPVLKVVNVASQVFSAAFQWHRCSPKLLVRLKA